MHNAKWKPFGVLSKTYHYDHGQEQGDRRVRSSCTSQRMRVLIHNELMHLFLPTSPERKVKSLLCGEQVFFLESDDQHNCLSDPADHSRLTEHVAKAFCLALCSHLKLLKEDGMTKLGLRVTLDSDQVRRVSGSL